MSKNIIYYLAVFLLAYAELVSSNQEMSLAEALVDPGFQKLLSLIDESESTAPKDDLMGSKNLLNDLLLMQLLNDQPASFETTTFPTTTMLPFMADSPQNTFVQNINSNKVQKKKSNYYQEPYKQTYPGPYGYGPGPYQPGYQGPGYPGQGYYPPEERERNAFDINALTEAAIRNFANVARVAQPQPIPNGFPPEFGGIGPMPPDIRVLSASKKPKQTSESDVESKLASLLNVLRETKAPSGTNRQAVMPNSQVSKLNLLKSTLMKNKSKIFSDLISQTDAGTNSTKNEHVKEVKKSPADNHKNVQLPVDKLVEKSTGKNSSQKEDEETPVLTEDELKQLLEP